MSNLYASYAWAMKYLKLLIKYIIYIYAFSFC